MAHGGYGKRRVAGRPPFSGAGRAGGRGGLGLRHKGKAASTKNQIRSIERLLKKDLPLEVKDVQLKRLEDLKKQAELHACSELERKMAWRYRKVKFFERRKIERRIRRLEKLQRAASDHPTEEMARQAADIAQQLDALKSDLEYIRFFPKTEKYVSLFMGNDNENVIALRNKLREQIKGNLTAAAAAGVDIEETGSEDDAMDLSEDDFFLVGSSSDDADADDEWTDKSSRPGDDKDDTSRELVPLSPGIVASDTKQHQHQKSNLGSSLHSTDAAPRNLSNNERNQHQKSARDLMPPPRAPSSSNSGGFQMKNWQSSGNSSDIGKTSSRPSSQSGEIMRRGKCPSSSNSWEILRASSVPAGNGSSNSDAKQKPRRKRTRSKKKKQQP